MDVHAASPRRFGTLLGTGAGWFASVVADGARMVGVLGGAAFGVLAAAFPNGPPACVAAAVLLAGAPVVAGLSAVPYISFDDPALLLGAAAMTAGAGTLALLGSGALAAHRRRRQMELDLEKSLSV